MRLMSSSVCVWGRGGLITPDEVLQLGANWLRIMSAVGRPDTLGEPEWGDGGEMERLQGASSLQRQWPRPTGRFLSFSLRLQDATPRERPPSRFTNTSFTAPLEAASFDKSV